MKKIKLSIVTRDEKYLQQLTNCLHRQEDIRLLNTIIIKNLKSEVKQAIAFMKQMVKQRPNTPLGSGHSAGCSSHEYATSTQLQG